MSDYASAASLPIGSGEPTGQGSDWMAEARRAFQQAEPQRALYAAREVLAVDGRNAEAWSIRARASFALEHYDDAEFEAREAVRLAPHIGTTHEILAGVLEVKQRFGEAMTEIEEAIRLDSSEETNRAVRASILGNSGRTSEAIEAWDELHQSDPDKELYRRCLAEVLYDEAEGQCTQLPGDRHAVTSPEQIAVIHRNTVRALALSFNDTDLRDSLRALQAQAVRAEQKRWSRPEHPFVYVIAIFISLAVAGYVVQGVQTVVIGLFGLAGLAGIVWLFVSRHYRPNWQYDAEAALVAIRRE